MSKTITLYTLPDCRQCDMTKKWLDKREITYQVIDISLTENKPILEAIKELGYTGAPVVIISEFTELDTHWYGFNPIKLEEHCAA